MIYAVNTLASDTAKWIDENSTESTTVGSDGRQVIKFKDGGLIHVTENDMPVMVTESPHATEKMKWLNNSYEVKKNNILGE
jgi:hypothetical protein